MEIVGQLTGGVVHDFNNILTVISGTIDILAEAVADRPDLAAITTLISEAAARGASLTSSLLAFSCGQPSQPCGVDVASLLADAARLLRPTLGEQIAISSKPVVGEQLVLADPSRLMAAILNLAIRARDAMPEGGKLGFEAGRADLEISAEDFVLIAVSASGYGSIAEHPEPVFADLGVVEDIVRQSGGHFEVRSEAGRGTSVKIYLPRTTAAAQSPDEADSERGDEAVLVVEDDALVREYVAGQIQSLGYRVLAAGNAREAMTLIDDGESIDLLFTDVMIPGPVSGRQLAIEAIGRRPLLKVLYTSGYADSALVQQGRLETGVMLLAKPYRKAELAKMIRAALAA
ncbi:MAG: putative sensor histidine kinase with a response regulator receiver domain [Bradyrhizobium sp.]|nr:putative sensor histidine kinase with a response regulator receiver domain [Bradyrhizobium sp.]